MCWQVYDPELAEQTDAFVAQLKNLLCIEKAFTGEVQITWLPIEHRTGHRHTLSMLVAAQQTVSLYLMAYPCASYNTRSSMTLVETALSRRHP